MTLSIHSPDELVAVIPHILGFKPEESIVFVPLRPELPFARVDLPTAPRDRELAWHSVREGFTRYAQPGARVGIVCLTSDRQGAESVSLDFAARLDTIGIQTRVRLWADDTQWCDLVTGETGVQTDAARERIAAETVLIGRAQPAASRESLATSLVGAREPLRDLLPEARDAASQSTPLVERRWALGRLHQFHADGVRTTDGDAARMLVAIDSIPTRDRLWNDMNRANAASHVALWTDLTRRAPDEVRAAPASMLAFASWLNGHGAMAWCALDEVPPNKPYALAGLVAAALQRGINPREWDSVRSRTSGPERDLGSGLVAWQRSTQHDPPGPAHGM